MKSQGSFQAKESAAQRAGLVDRIAPTEKKLGSPMSNLVPAGTNFFQRKCACGGSAGILGKCADCDGTRLSIQRFARPHGGGEPFSRNMQALLNSSSELLDRGGPSFTESGLGHNVGSINIRNRTAPTVQPMLAISEPGDRYEREADRVAAQVMTMPDAATVEPANYQRDTSVAQTGQLQLVDPAAAQNLNFLHGGGRPLAMQERSFLQPRLGYDFSRVRIHTDQPAAELATSVNALAFTIGRDIFFGPTQYNPRSWAGQKLLAHELTHVVQQAGRRELSGERSLITEPAATKESSRSNVVHRNLQRPSPQEVTRSHRPSISRIGSIPYVMRQSAPQAAPQPAAPAAGPLVFLQEISDFLTSLISFVDAILSTNASPLLQQPTRPQIRQGRSGQGQAHVPVYQRVHRALNQQHLQQLLNSAQTEYNRQDNVLPSNDPQRIPLRDLYVRVLDQIRNASARSLDASNQLDRMVRDAEQVQYAETMARLIEASPMTSTGLTRTTAFQQGDVTAGTNYEAALEHYLDDLLARLPSLTLGQAQRDQIFERIQVALRRAFVTVASGPGGVIDVRGISNPQIVDKYRRVSALLSGVSSPVQMSIITDPMPAYQLPNPVPNVSAQPGGRTVDVSRVPADEVDSVRYGIAQAVSTIFAPATTIVLRNAYWPVSLQVLRAGSVPSVRYELVFDSAGNVRAERLGEARAREAPPAFTQLSVTDKKAQLVTDFGLVGVDDRPARAGAGGRPARTAANWSGAELDQLKAAFDLIPQAGRTALNGLTLVRDHQGPPQAGSSILMGFHHTGQDDAHDQPGPPPHGPPHIHYYDEAFTRNALLSVGAPGATGPGGDFTLLHEVGHAQVAIASNAASAAVTAANARINQALGPLRRVPLTGAQQPGAWRAYNQAQSNASQAIVNFHNSMTSTPAASTAQQAQLLQTAQTAVAARNAARPGLAAAGFSQAIVQAAAALDAANDALLVASQQLAVARDQVPTFVSLASRFGFHRFTHYARTGTTDEEWFAETYALHLTDPNRLNQMNRSIFLWFEAGMPMDRSWNP